MDDKLVNDTAYFELEEQTAFGTRWAATGTRAAAKRYRLTEVPGSINWGDKSLGGADGIACWAPK
jgi:hypothetical protein